jgi:ssDNA-binding Zn-finger/Zn-ribbon topoisomerase 1
MATCPECEFDEVDTSDLEEGDAVSCPECGKGLVVAANGDLDYADDEEDDLDDDDDEDEEEEDLEDEDVVDDDEDAVDEEDE